MAAKSVLSSSSLEVLLPVAVGIVLPLAWAWRVLRPPRIPDIEALPDNSLVGHSLNGADTTKLHELQLERAKKHGSVFQYRFYGNNIVVFNDMRLAKIAFRGVTGKGM